MHSRSVISVWFRYATIALLLAVGVLALAAVLRSQNSLQGRLIAPSSTAIPFARFSADRTQEGVSLPSDTNVLVSVPPNIEAIARITFFGGPDFDNSPYWGYCYDGGEADRKVQGLRGNQLYPLDRFFYSKGELGSQRSRTTVTSSTDLASIARSKATAEPILPVSYREILHGGDLCYVMSSVILPVSTDNDGDGANNMLEKMSGTDPNNPDTDGDGISDGQELFVLRTNPLTFDSDSDGLPDGLEDKNQNGKLDSGETDPNNADTNRDGLCDGDGTASGCPERKYENAYKTDNCPPEMPAAECRILPLIRGSDMNQDGAWQMGEIDPSIPETYPPLTNWQWKWEQLQKTPGHESIRVP